MTMIVDDDAASDYRRFRGRCHELSTAAVAADPTLTLVRGHYVCPVWGEQEHWWTLRADGIVSDPTAHQFPSRGLGLYVPYRGVASCAECGVEMPEGDVAIQHGRYGFCSDRCARRCVGL